jgi:hypothetical protein
MSQWHASTGVLVSSILAPAQWLRGRHLQHWAKDADTIRFCQPPHPRESGWLFTGCCVDS